MTVPQAADVENSDLRSFNDAGRARDTASGDSGADTERPVDVSVPDTDSDDLADADANIECSFDPHCAGPNTLRHCVDGVARETRCPDDFACPDGAIACEPQICSPEDDDICVDEETAQQCVDYGTRLVEFNCPFCVNGECPDTCADGARRCVDSQNYEICSGGEWTIESCPIDELGTACSAGGCMTACERAAAESDYAGCVFWAVDLDNIVDPLGAGPGADGVAVVISNVSELLAQVEIEGGAAGSVLRTATLAPGELRTIELPPENLLGTRLNAGAFRITTSVPVLAYQFNPLNREGTSSTDASLLFPESALAERYRILTYPAQGANQRGFITMIGVGVEPTTVSLTAVGRTIAGVEYRPVDGPLVSHRLDALSTGQTQVRMLEPFDVWQVESGAVSDLTGSLVLSDAPLAVFAGTRCSNIPEGVPNCDHLEHQMLSVASWDRTHVATPGPIRGTETTRFRVLADVDGTLVETIPAVLGTPVTLDAGDVLTFDTRQATAIFSSQPTLVGQYLASGDAGADGLGDPSFTLVPPVEQYRDNYTFFVPNSYANDTMTVIRSLGESANITLDGVDLIGAFGDIFDPVGDSGYEVAYIDIDDGVHRLESERPLGVLVAGFDQDVSYAYPGGLQLYKRSDFALDEPAQRCSDGGWLGAQCDTGEPGWCAIGVIDCDPDSVCLPHVAPALERCNGVDDDCDGEVDEGGVCVPDNEFYFVSPGGPMLELAEGDVQEFRAFFADESVELLWYLDDPDAPVAQGETLTWTILGFEAGVHHVWVEARSGDAFAEYEWLVQVQDAPTNAPTIYGRVFDRDGQTVPDIPIRLMFSSTTWGEPSWTDFRGYYAHRSTPGTHQLLLYERWDLSFPKGRRQLGEVTVPDNEDVRFDVLLPIARVYGTVYGPGSDGSPEPIRGASVNLSAVDTATCSSCSDYAFTDDDGFYNLLLFTGSTRLLYRAPTALELAAQTIELNIEADTRQDVYLERIDATEVLVTFTDSCTGNPVPDVWVRFYQPGVAVTGTTDENGQLRANLPDGEFAVSVSGLAAAEAPMAPGTVGVGEIVIPGTDTADFEVPNARVFGTVTAADGTPLADVELYFDGDDAGCRRCEASAVSDDLGNYELYLLDSDYQVVVTPPTAADWPNFLEPSEGTRRIETCDERFDIQLTPPIHRLVGRVTAMRLDADGSLISAPVDKLQFGYDGSTSGSTTTDATGRFEIVVPPGAVHFYDLLLADDSSFDGVLPGGTFTFWHSDERLIGADPETPIELEVEIELPMSFVSGRVTNIEGGGLGFEGAELYWNYPYFGCFPCRQTVVTDVNGYYEVMLYRPYRTADGLWEGDYTVQLDLGESLPSLTYEHVMLTESVETWDVAIDE